MTPKESAALSRYREAFARAGLSAPDHNFAPFWNGNSVRWGWRAKLIEPRREMPWLGNPGLPLEGEDDWQERWDLTDSPIFYRDAAGRFVSAPFRMSASDIIKEALATMNNRLVVEISPP